MGSATDQSAHPNNLQTAVDADTGLFLHHEVTTEPTDNRLLYPVADAGRRGRAQDRLPYNLRLVSLRRTCDQYLASAYRRTSGTVRAPCGSAQLCRARL